MRTTTNKVSEAFLARADLGRGIMHLLDFLPHTFYYIKDIRGRFVWMNAFFLKQIRRKDIAEIQGKTDFDIWPAHQATSYTRDDKKVLETDKPVLNRIEPVKNLEGGFDWYSTSKAPLKDASGNLMGLIGQSALIKKNIDPPFSALKMAPVIHYIMEHYAENIPMEKLARLACLSVRSFERKFKQNFDLTPLKFIHKVRIETACQLLSETELSLSEIAMDTGFYDNSHFTKQFRAYTGLLPNAYRAKYAGSG